MSSRRVNVAAEIVAFSVVSSIAYAAMAVARTITVIRHLTPGTRWPGWRSTRRAGACPKPER
jgi:hypothetical protein